VLIGYNKEVRRKDDADKTCIYVMQHSACTTEGWNKKECNKKSKAAQSQHTNGINAMRYYCE